MVKFFVDDVEASTGTSHSITVSSSGIVVHCTATVGSGESVQVCRNSVFRLNLTFYHRDYNCCIMTMLQ